MSGSIRIFNWRKRVDGLLGRRNAYKLALDKARQDVKDFEEEYYDTDEAQQIVQAVAETIQEEAHNRIAGVVTQCLTTVFPDEPCEFKINFERARGRTEARLVFVQEGKEIVPLESDSGGMVDVAAFALRLSSLMLSRPACRRVVVLDEPFKFVSVGHRAAVRAMLERLTKDLGVQFIMVTHIEELRCGHIIDLG